MLDWLDSKKGKYASRVVQCLVGNDQCRRGGGGWEGLGQVQCACAGTLCFLLALFQEFVILDGTCFIAKTR